MVPGETRLQYNVRCTGGGAVPFLTVVRSRLFVCAFVRPVFPGDVVTEPVMQARTVLISLVLGLGVFSIAQAGSVGTSGAPTGRYGNLWFGPGALPGDLNDDGKVDFLDYMALKMNMGTQVQATWANGDFDADGHVGMSDLIILEQNFGVQRGIWSPTDDEPGPAGAVPEPLTILGLILGAGGVAGYIRKRQLA